MVRLNDVVANDDILKKCWRINLINPGVELEWPLSAFTSISVNPGIGYGISYKNLNNSLGSGFTGLVSPFVDTEWRWFYNRNKRLDNGKSLDNNAGNYMGVRFLVRGNEFASQNMWRTDSKDFAVGAVWGLQRGYGPVHLLFNTGFLYYFDVKGNSGVFLPSLQMNIGWWVR